MCTHAKQFTHLDDFCLDFSDGLLECFKVRGSTVIDVHDENPGVNVKDVSELIQDIGEDGVHLWCHLLPDYVFGAGRLGQVRV